MNAAAAEGSADDQDTAQDHDEESTERATEQKKRPRRSTTEGTARRSSPSSSGSRSSSGKPSSDKGSSDKGSSGKRSRGRISAVNAVKQAIEQFSTLTGRPPESVIGTRWQDDHWSVRLEVVESRRIPDSADLLAEYEIELDGDGDLLAYDRKDRYVRGRPSE